jgi:hypothetical protein
MRYKYSLLFLLVAACACAGSPQTLPLGRPGDFGDLVRSRADLEQRLADYEASLATGQYSDEERRRIVSEIAVIRERLDYGDFRVGDRILMSVQGEASLPDTVTVRPGRVIDLPLFGEISVAGVLRSEIESHLTQSFSAFIRDPVVRADGLLRVSVIGAVGQPGFYTMPAETVLGDAIMLAGGPNGNANLEQVRIRRGTEEIMDGPTSRLALQQGLTLDQLNLVAGDQVTIPERRGFLNLLAIFSTIVGSLGFVLYYVFR